ncbi:hypothetical protein ACN469_17510 [Corallococcus terminator]
MSEAKPAEETPVVQGPAVSGAVPKQAPVVVDSDAPGETVGTPPESARPDVRDPPPSGPPG